GRNARFLMDDLGGVAELASGLAPNSRGCLPPAPARGGDGGPAALSAIETERRELRAGIRLCLHRVARRADRGACVGQYPGGAIRSCPAGVATWHVHHI